MSEALAGGAAFPVPHCRVPTIVLDWVLRRRKRKRRRRREEEKGEEFHGFVLRSFQGVPVVSSGQLHACMDACLLA
jgi:hypothetical protein